MSEAENTLRFTATVEQADDEIVILDVEGRRVKLPRDMLPGNVSEGAGYVLTLAPAPVVAASLKQSVEDRLRALQSANPANTLADPARKPK